MFRVLLGSILAAVILMIWGFVFWTILPFPLQVMQGVPEEDAVVTVLKTSIPESGTYIYPMPIEPTGSDTEKKAAEEAFMKKHKDGPLVRLVYVKDGSDPMSPTTYVLGMVHYFISGLIVASLLYMAAGGMQSFFTRMLFVMGLGLFAAVFIEGSNVIWWHAPPAFPLMTGAFQFAGWVLVSPVLALIVKSRPAAA